MEKQKTIYDLELHEELRIDGFIVVLRVHGGFIYNQYVTSTDPIMNSTFVPYEDPLILNAGTIDFIPLPDRNSRGMYIDKYGNHEKKTD